MSNREKYEQLILASPLFSLDKENERNAYQREARKMVGYLYSYLLEINENRYIDYGLEITETANRCIENFDATSGDFLHYFNAAMAKEYRRASAKRNMQEVRSGLHISEEDDKNIRRMLKLLEAKGITNPTEEQLGLLADALDVSVETVRNTVISIHETSVISDVAYNNDGEEISLFDTVVSDIGVDSDMIDAEACAALLSKIENAYLTCQERQKPLLSAMMTIKICEVVCSCGISVEAYSFVNKEIIETYIKCGTLPTQREIADRFGKNEASVSRTVKEFLEKIKNDRGARND